MIILLRTQARIPPMKTLFGHKVTDLERSLFYTFMSISLKF